MNRGKVIVFAAPSGAGKSTIINRIMSLIPDLKFSVSSTTRPVRKGEIAGVNYDYLDRKEFMHLVEKGDFLEYEEVHGELYGTRTSKVEEMLSKQENVIFDLDVLGALSIKKFFPDALMLYIKPPSIEELRRRLVNRGRENEEEIERRLQRCRFEQSMADRFEISILNDDLELAVQEVSRAIKNHLEKKTDK